MRVLEFQSVCLALKSPPNMKSLEKLVIVSRSVLNSSFAGGMYTAPTIIHLSLGYISMAVSWIFSSPFIVTGEWEMVLLTTTAVPPCPLVGPSVLYTS